MRNLIALLALIAFVVPAYAHHTDWTGNVDNDWFELGNWTNGLPQSNSGDTAAINNGGTACVLAGATGVGAWGGGTTVGDNTGSGTLEIGAGGDLNSNLYVGNGGTGTVIIKDGGSYKVTAYLNLYSTDSSNSRLELYGGSEIREVGYVQIGKDSGSGLGELVQHGGSIYARSDYPVRIGVSGGHGIYTMHGGSLNIHRVDMGKYSSSGGSATWNITSTDVDITIGDIDDSQSSMFYLHSDYDINISATEGAPGETVLIKMVSSSHGNAFRGTGGKDAQVAGLNNITMQFEGTYKFDTGAGPNTYEVAGKDIGDDVEGFTNNFALEGLTLVGGTADELAFLKLLDDSDNMGAESVGTEALYVENLTIEAGSILDVAGLNLYYLHGSLDGIIYDSIGGGGVYQIPEPTTLALLTIGGFGALLRRKRRSKGTKRSIKNHTGAYRNCLIGLMIMVTGASVTLADDTYWTLTPSEKDHWIISTNWSNGMPRADDNAYIDNGGTAQIIGGDAYCLDAYVGYSYEGKVELSLGRNLVHGNLVLGHEAGSNGTYELAGGKCMTSRLMVGRYGTGQFIQTSGTLIRRAGTPMIYIGAMQDCFCKFFVVA